MKPSDLPLPSSFRSQSEFLAEYVQLFGLYSWGECTQCNHILVWFCVCDSIYINILNMEFTVFLFMQRTSILEQHHCSATKAILREVGLLDHLPNSEREEIISLMEELILSTDFTKHKSFMATFEVCTYILLYVVFILIVVLFAGDVDI